jgi:S-ribosylhomocysteine lyase LuxS involved in autoinducer biosynthesis
MFLKEWVVNDGLDQSSDSFSLSTTQEDKVWIDKGNDMSLSQPLVQAIQHLPACFMRRHNNTYHFNTIAIDLRS